jgi:hypothetical protein
VSSSPVDAEAHVDCHSSSGGGGGGGGGSTHLKCCCCCCCCSFIPNSKFPPY